MYCILPKGIEFTLGNSKGAPDDGAIVESNHHSIIIRHFLFFSVLFLASTCLLSSWTACSCTFIRYIWEYNYCRCLCLGLFSFSIKKKAFQFCYSCSKKNNVEIAIIMEKGKRCEKARKGRERCEGTRRKWVRRGERRGGRGRKEGGGKRKMNRERGGEGERERSG